MNFAGRREAPELNCFLVDTDSAHAKDALKLAKRCRAGGT
jgi:hypothetical protein